MTTAGNPPSTWNEDRNDDPGGRMYPRPPQQPQQPPQQQWQEQQPQQPPRQQWREPGQQPQQPPRQQWQEPGRQPPQQGQPSAPAGKKRDVKTGIIALAAGFLLNTALWTPMAQQTLGWGDTVESTSVMAISGGPINLIVASVIGLISVVLGIMGLVVLIGKKKLAKPVGILAIVAGILGVALSLMFAPLAESWVVSQVEAEYGAYLDMLQHEVTRTSGTWIALALCVVVIGLGVWAMIGKKKE